jgi:membrane fusion protein, type I secretion system
MIAAGAQTKPMPQFHRPVVLGLVTFAVLVLGVGGWMALTKISGAVVASGSIAVKGEAKTIQHLDGGIVTEILVSNGDIVKAGDPLVRLDRTLLGAQLTIYGNRLAEAVARRARLVAERDGEDQIHWPDKNVALLGIVPTADVRLSQAKLLNVRRANKRGQHEQLEQKILQHQNQIEGVIGLKKSVVEQIKLIDRELSGIKELYAKGNTTLQRVLALEREKSKLLGRQAEQDAQLARVSNLISETRIQIVQVDHEFGEKNLSELRQVEQEINDLVQQYYSTREKLGRVVIKAPASGMVHQLQVFTIGGVISSGAAVMQIVPVGEAIEVVAHVEPQFIDELSVGQMATLQFSAFGDLHHKPIEGVVRSISPSSVLDEKTGQGYYVVRMEVPDAEMVKIGGRDRLIPGMPVTTFLKKQDRTVLNYLMRPLTDQIKLAFREN